MTLRNTTATVDTNAAKPITSPTWLVEILWPNPDTVRFSSRGPAPIVHDSRTFDLLGVRVNSVSDTDASFTLQNELNTISALVSLHGANDWPVKVWSYYETDGVLLFDGFLDGCDISDKEVRFQATRIPAGMAGFPTRLFTRRNFPYLPKKDQVVKWGGASYTLKASRRG